MAQSSTQDRTVEDFGLTIRVASLSMYLMDSSPQQPYDSTAKGVQRLLGGGVFTGATGQLELCSNRFWESVVFCSIVSLEQEC